MVLGFTPTKVKNLEYLFSFTPNLKMGTPFKSLQFAASNDPLNLKSYQSEIICVSHKVIICHKGSIWLLHKPFT